MRSLIVPAAGAIFLLGSAAVAADEPSLDEVDALVEPHVGKEAPGIAVLVMRKGKVLHMQGYG